MQSGISATAELQDAFRSFTSTPSLFALPITITSEALTPLPTIPFTSSSFTASLPSLQDLLKPSTPLYLILRRDSGDLVAITYIPSTSPVRSKTLFASTRATLVRELGTEKFADTVFVTEPAEVLDTKEWDLRDKGNDGTVDEALLTREERELGEIKRKEEEERFGTQGRDIGWGGGQASAGQSGQGRLSMKVKDGVTEALKQKLAQAGGVVILGIDIPTETFVLHSSFDSVSPAELSSKIPADQPSYTFYTHPSTSTVLFAYTCPPGMPIKQRMLYASSRNSVPILAQNEGIEVAKKIEAGGPEEVDEDRLASEFNVTAGGEGASGAGASARQGFARPKRPGRR